MGNLMILFMMASAQNNLPQGLLSSLCYIESGHKVNAFHRHDGKGNSVGICQIKLATAKMLGFKGTEKQLMEPGTNITYAAKYLAKQIKRYHSMNKGIIAYNMGNAKNLTTSQYQVKVIQYWKGKNVQSKRRYVCSI
jgi:soluble lytic murein transglycosylase-like protein